MINMEEAKLKTLEQVKAFLGGTPEVAFRVPKEWRNPPCFFPETITDAKGKERKKYRYQGHDDAL